MLLENFLTRNRSHILKKWFNSILETYPPETAKILKREKDQFANPVGHTIYHGMQGLFDELLKGLDPEKISPFLDRIIRIRAIQDFSPAEAISFVFDLKSVVREELNEREDVENSIEPEDLLKFETSVDAMALIAFNIYSSCREKLYELRVNEVKNRTYRLLQRANLLVEMPEQEPLGKVEDS